MEFFANPPPRANGPRFTHLKVYSSYTLGIGVNTPAEICAHAARVGYPSVAITDIGGTYGFIEFHLAAKKSGVKPIYGIVVRHLPEGRHGEEGSLVTMIAASPPGLRHVAALASLTATEEGGSAGRCAGPGRSAVGIPVQRSPPRPPSRHPFLPRPHGVYPRGALTISRSLHAVSRVGDGKR